MPTACRHLLAIPLLVLGTLALAACDEGSTATTDRQQTRATLEELRDELDEGITPERKEQLVRRCTTALEQARRQVESQADRLATFCDSLEETDPTTPAAWDDIRRRLDELIAQVPR
jgi:hypothetical protein